MLRRFAIICLICSALFAFSSCEEKENADISSAAENKKPEQNNVSSQVELKSYGFPEFLEDAAAPDMLSNCVFSSFQSAERVSPVEEQPFSGYVCELSLDGEYYIYRDGEYVGLLNSSGTIMVKADKYVSAEFVSPELVKLDKSGSDGEPSEYARIRDGYASMVEGFGFNAENIGFSETVDEADGRILYQLTVNEIPVYDMMWDSVSEITDRTELVTYHNYEAAYKATLSGMSYIITFDKYYNFNVYEGVYGMLSLKVGSVYGECYILSFEDYGELTEMISSFGSESRASAPSKDENLDFIQVTLGMNKNSRTKVTISSDGYCFTEKSASEEQPANKYFSVLSKETFVDLVNWADYTLSHEYEDVNAPIE